MFWTGVILFIIGATFYAFGTWLRGAHRRKESNMADEAELTLKFRRCQPATSPYGRSGTLRNDFEDQHGHIWHADCDPETGELVRFEREVRCDGCARRLGTRVADDVAIELHREDMPVASTPTVSAVKLCAKCAAEIDEQFEAIEKCGLICHTCDKEITKRQHAVFPGPPRVEMAPEREVHHATCWVKANPTV